MASRRTSSSRGGSSSSRRRRPAPASSGVNPALIIGIGVVVVIAIVALTVDWSGEKKPEDNTGPAKKAAAPEKKQPDVKKPAIKAEEKPGKDPSRPAPTIEQGDIKKAEGHYKKASALDVQARKAQSKGERKEFVRLINDAYDEIEKGLAALSKYDGWLDEAEFEDWRIPAELVALQKRMGRYTKLQGRIRRVRPRR